MNGKRLSIGKTTGAIIIFAVAAGVTGLALWQKHSPAAPSTADTSAPIVVDKTAVDPALLTRLQADLQGITPYFVDTRSYDGKPLTPQEEKIRNDIADILTSKAAANGHGDDYSQIWPVAIGKRYVLITVPTHTYYDMLIDSQTGESSYLQNAASYVTHRLPFERPQPASRGRQTVLYIGYEDIYTYTLDEGTFVLVPGSGLSGSETYHNGKGDFSLMVDETHTDNSIHISVYDGSQAVQNPNAQPNALQTMNKKIREVDLVF
jgi:hypothetical protein